MLVVFIMGFGVYAFAEKTVKATGYNDTIVVVSVVDNNCNAVVFKLNEPKKSVSCEEANQIIATFPKEDKK